MYLKIKLTFSFLLIIISFNMNAQNISKITGTVLNENKELTIGNVIIMSVVDSSLITGTSFFEETFEVDNINEKEILIKLTSLQQFKDTIFRINYNGESEIDLGEIIVGNVGVELNEVVVKGRIPTYVQKPDGTIEVLIENTTLSSSNSLNEILSKSPEIIVDESGAISLFGKGNAIIYLNGKRITDSQLSLISPSNVKKIEIIRNPSAKYDADGAAVVNIHTIQQGDDGYLGSIKQNISYSIFGGTLFNSYLNLNYKKGRFSSNAFYTLQVGKNRELLHTTRKRDAENVFLTTDLTTDWKRDYKNFSTYGLGLQYDITNKSYLSLEYSGFFESLGGNTFSENTIVDDNSTSFYESHESRDEKDFNHSISANYNLNMDSLGSSFFVGGQYSNFNIGTDNSIFEESMEENNSSFRHLKNISSLYIDIFSSQIDYTKKLKNGNVLEAGTKYSYVLNDFGFEFLVSEDDINYELDNDISNDFKYEESIASAYINYKGKFKNNINYTLGLRSEYTIYDLDLSPTENQTIKDKYINLFPNFSIGKTFSEDYNLNFSYTSKINRPAYHRLNPVLIYQDPYTSVQGNPKLRPQKTHAFELNSNIKKTNFKIGYNYMLDPFGGAAVRGEDPKSYILKAINYEKQHLWFTSVSRTFNTKWFTSTNTISLKYTRITETEYDFKTVESKPNIYVYSNNRFHITDSFKAEFLFWLRGQNNEGLHIRRRLYNITLALEKSFLNNSLKCRLIANDIFHNYIAKGDYNVAQTDVYYNRRWSTDYFRLSVIYNFGKLKKVGYKNNSVGGSENDRAR